MASTMTGRRPSQTGTQSRAGPKAGPFQTPKDFPWAGKFAKVAPQEAKRSSGTQRDPTGPNESPRKRVKHIDAPLQPFACFRFFMHRCYTLEHVFLCIFSAFCTVASLCTGAKRRFIFGPKKANGCRGASFCAGPTNHQRIWGSHSPLTRSLRNVIEDPLTLHVV